MSSFRSHTQLKQDTDDSDRPSRSSSRISTIDAQYYKWSRQSTRSYQGSISNSSDHNNVSVNDDDSLRFSREGDTPRVSRNFSVSASSDQDSSVSDHKSTYSLSKSAFLHRNQSQSTIRTGLGAGPDTLSTAPSTPTQNFSPLSAPFDQDNVSSSAGYTYPIVIPSSSPPPVGRIDSASRNSNKTGLPKEWRQPPTYSPQGSGITKSNQEENLPAPGSSRSPSIPGIAQPTLELSKSVDDSYIPTTVQPNLDRSSSQQMVSKAQRNDTLVRANTTKDRHSSAPPATVKASTRESPSSSTFPPPRRQKQQQHQQHMGPENRDQRDGKPGLRTWWQQITTTQRSPPPASAHEYPNSHSNSHTQEYVRPPPGVVFGRPLKESLKYASVQISTADASGNLYVWGYIPIVVAKCGLFLKENATEVEGIFHVSGSNRRMRELQEIFETPPRYGKSLEWRLENFTTHDVAGVFRRYLNQMPEPVIPYNLYFPFRDAIANKPYNIDMVISTYKRLIHSMPHANQYLILYVLDLLSVCARKSDRNLMTAYNLAVIFRPGLISHPKHELQPSEHRLSQEVLEFLIAHQDWFMLDTPPPPAPTPSRSLTPPFMSRSTGTSLSLSDDEGPDGWRIIEHHRGSRTADTGARQSSLLDGPLPWISHTPLR